MSEDAAALARLEIRAARRLARLFRIECRGGFERRPVTIVTRLIERRGAVVAALLAVDLERRALAVRPPAELAVALRELAREIDLALPYARARLEQIGKDLRLSRGEGWVTGIRDTDNGHPLGTT
jgi:hypothetical protein